MKLKKLCYMGAYDPEYARNTILRKGLQEQDIEIVECRISPQTPLWSRNMVLWKTYTHIPHDFDAILVAEMNQLVVPLAKLAARLHKKPLIFDMFYSLHDAYVNDRRSVRSGSLKARFFYGLDKISGRLPDLLLTDTRQHAIFFRDEFGVREDRIVPIYVGCDTGVFSPETAPNPEGTQFTVTFMGTFIPLHGIEYILRAAKLLEEHEDIHFEIIGKGQTYPEMKALANRLSLKNCTFSGSAPLQELPSLISRSDVCLGIFGNTAKARRVIPNKAYQALAMKKPLITGDSPAIREVFQDGEDLLLCPMADEHALADAILRLKNSPDLRDRLAETGYQKILKQFTPSALGKQLKNVVEERL